MHVLVIDDHPLIREALRGALLTARPDAAVTEAPDGHSARAILAHERFDLILLDLGLPDVGGLAILEDLRASHPATAVAVLSASEDRADMMRAFDLGAVGFIPKSASLAVMLRAFELILAGGVYVPVQALDPASPRAPGPRARTSLPGLTDRQIEVLTLMMEGHSNKAICRILDIAEPTVKNHVTAILRSLGARNRTEAVLAAQARFRGEA